MRKVSTVVLSILLLVSAGGLTQYSLAGTDDLLTVGIPMHTSFEEGQELVSHKFWAKSDQSISVIVYLPQTPEATATLLDPGGEVYAVVEEFGIVNTQTGLSINNDVLYFPQLDVSEGGEFTIEIARTNNHSSDNYVVSAIELISGSVRVNAQIDEINTYYVAHLDLEQGQVVNVSLIDSEFDGLIGVGIGQLEYADELNSTHDTASFRVPDAGIYTLLYIATVEDIENAGQFTIQIDLLALASEALP